MAKVPIKRFEELFAIPLRNGLTRPKSVRGDGVRMVNMGEIFAHTRIGNIEMDRVPLADKEVPFLLEPGDLLFARQSLVLSGAGKCSLFLGAKEPVTFESHLIRSRLRLDTADPAFYFYFFSSPKGRQTMESIVEQVAAAGIRGSDLARLEVPHPPLAAQKAIAAVLGALDDKIELNRRMNTTLEAMAQALYQSWFVDFDPVRAKLDLRQPPGLDAATAALFPNEFEQSELGPIPKGWNVDTLKNRASGVQYGLTQSASTEPIGPRFLRITDIRGGSVDWSSVPFCRASVEEREKYCVKDGDIFVARTGASTGDNIYLVEPPGAVFASYLVRIQFPSRGIGRLVGEFMRAADYTNHIAGSIGGSAQPNASAQTLASASMIFPTEAIADAFYCTVRPLDLQRAANDRESRILASLRDTLLPKLLSAELATGDVRGTI